jgi:hypothetical protein
MKNKADKQVQVLSEQHIQYEIQGRLHSEPIKNKLSSEKITFTF